MILRVNRNKKHSGRGETERVTDLAEKRRAVERRGNLPLEY
jgi:hypothetical protein